LEVRALGTWNALASFEQLRVLHRKQITSRRFQRQRQSAV